MQLAAHLYDKGLMSPGQAANMVGISKREFIETVGQYGVFTDKRSGTLASPISGNKLPSIQLNLTFVYPLLRKSCI